jgi:transcriptional regulator with XRE-family HTH domain
VEQVDIHPVEQVLRQRERTISWLAGKLGISASYMWRVLHGERRPTPRIKRRIAEVLDVPESLLFPEDRR